MWQSEFYLSWNILVAKGEFDRQNKPRNGIATKAVSKIASCYRVISHICTIIYLTIPIPLMQANIP